MPIREIIVDNKEDLQNLTKLMNQWDDLGVVSFETIAERVRNIQAKKDSVIFLYGAQGKILGYIHLVECVYLGLEPFAEVQSILVDDSVRRQGIGRKLMEQGEQWARARGLKTVSLSSRIKLTKAHQFYQKLGYENYKQSYFFKKVL
jgi:GNAT superfamily N-acetyltransferase